MRKVGHYHNHYPENAPTKAEQSQMTMKTENKQGTELRNGAIATGAGAGAGAVASSTIGGIGVAAGGTAVGIGLGTFVLAGACVGAAGYGLYYLGKKVSRS